jgi:hypothetical protein
LNASAESEDQERSSGNEFGVIVVAVGHNSRPAQLTAGKPRLIRSSEDRNPTAAVVEVRNVGGRVAKALGQMILERTTGQRILTKEIGATQEEIILPGMIRDFRMPIGALDAGEFRVRVEVRVADGDGSSIRSEAVFTSVSTIPEGL